MTLTLGFLQVLGFDAWQGDLDWVSKSFTSLFMGGAFAASGMWMAPSHRRAVGLAGVAIVAWWAFGLATGGPDGWGKAMAASGLIGAVTAAFWVAQMETKEEVAPHVPMSHELLDAEARDDAITGEHGLGQMGRAFTR